MSFWSAIPSPAAMLQTARDNAASAANVLMERSAATREVIAAYGAPVAEIVMDKGVPLALQAKEQAVKVGGTIARAAGPKTSSQVRGLFAGSAVKERGLMRCRGPMVPGGTTRWVDATVLLDEGILKVYNGWEAMEGDVPMFTIDIAEVQTIAEDTTVDEEPHCFAVSTSRADTPSSTNQTTFQANNAEECRTWIGLLQGVANSLSLRSQAGKAISTTSTVVMSKLPTAITSSAAPATITAQARGFFTSAKYEGLLRVPGHLAGQPSTAARKQKVDVDDDFDILGELEPSGEHSFGSRKPAGAEELVDAWVVLADGQLKIYKDEEDFELMGTAQTVIEMANVTAVVEHGDLEFELVMKSTEGSDSSSRQPQPDGASSQESYVFKALVIEDRATWVGLLRGVEQSLLAKSKLIGGKQVVEGTITSAATILRSKYQEYSTRAQTSSDM